MRKEIKENHNDQDTYLENVADELLEAEYSEYAHLFEEDEQFQQKKHLVDGVRYEESTAVKDETREEKRQRTKTKWGKSLGKVAAIAAVVCVVFTVVVPIAEADAWKIWNLDFLFGEHDDHAEIQPNDEDKFPQYCVSEIPYGFDIAFENATETGIYIQYYNEREQFIVYTQIKREQYISQLDNEKHDIAEEVISDFSVRVIISENDTIFEAVTDTVAITVQTNAGYETGKKFIESLRKT